VVESLALWRKWATSSDQGLWEDDGCRGLSFKPLSTHGGTLPPHFFSVESFAIRGDTVFITDPAANRLVALDHRGDLMWAVGQPGEGPGDFAHIGQVAVSPTHVAVADVGNNRVNLLTRRGRWQRSFAVQQPYDICFAEDSLLAVVTTVEAGGAVHLYDTGGEALASFGEWTSPFAGLRFTRDLHCAIIQDSLLAVCSYYQQNVQLYSLRERTLKSTLTRALPFKPATPAAKGGESDSVFFALDTFLLDVFEGPEGMVNVLLRPFAPDRSLQCAEKGMAEVSIIDRFDLQGNYLDSYVVPASLSQVVYHNGELWGSHEGEGAIYRYSVERAGE
jgi:hypothetical protein